jgi:hypothetical protein
MVFIINQSYSKILAYEPVNIPEEPCYLEDLIQQIALDKNSPPLTSEFKSLLPYLIYGDMYLARMGTIDKAKRINYCADYTSPKNNHSSNSSYYSKFRFDMDFAFDIRTAMTELASKSYMSKYGHLRHPPIHKDDIPVYEKRASQGDLSAMFELRRYYEYPFTENFNPEQTMARFWMFKAIEAGDEASMLEVGYDRPYTVRTDLIYENINIALDVACEGIDKSSYTPYPACFLYTLIIGDTSDYPGYIVLDQEHLSGNSLRPQTLSLVKIKNQVVVELISYADRKPENARHDYFSLKGHYLGSNNVKFSPDYFWNFRGLTSFAKTDVHVINAKKAKKISRINVRRLPYIETFLFWEINYNHVKRLKALDDLIPSDARPDDFNSMSQESCNLNNLLVSNRRDEDIKLYRRLNNFFILDPYYKNRLENLPGPSLSPLENGYSKINDNYLNDPCEYHSPRTLFYEFRYFPCDRKESFIAYEKFNNRPSYIIEIGSDIESAKMYQICRYAGHYSDNKDHLENPVPCYAVLIKFKNSIGYKYHYVINTIPQIQGPQVYKRVERSSLDFETGNLIKGDSFYILSSLLFVDSHQYFLNPIRVDIFDINFNYVGSNNPVLSRIMVPNYKPLPGEFYNQLNYWISKNLLSANKSGDFDYYPLVYPECSDIIIEQRYRQNFRNKGDVR